MSSLPKNIFVTGIGTGVGKTIASAVLTEALYADYWKPIQCGGLDNTDSMVVKSLISNQATKIHAESYRLKTASSPHYAAKAEGVTIDMYKCVRPETEKRLIIEGAGGLMVPLNDKDCVINLILALRVPAILICRNYLGSINHTLLSISMLKQRGVQLTGLIFVGDNFMDNEEIIQHFGNTPILAKIDEAAKIDKEFILQQAYKLREIILKTFTL